MMKGEWKETTLRGVSNDISYGYTASAEKEKIGPNFLRITDIQNGIVEWNNVPYCTISEANLSKYKLHKDDIVVARTGNSTGENYIVDRECEAVFASYLIRFRIRANIALPKYVWYNMRSNAWWSFINSVKTGSAQPGANAKLLGLYKIHLPPLAEQKAIAHVLGSLDDMIELNRQMNKTLEDMAQAIFKSWFVDFDPVIQNALDNGKEIPPQFAERAELIKKHPLSMPKETLELFPDAFIQSELGLIPQGWGVGKLGDIATVKGGYAFKSKDFVGTRTSYPVVKIKNITENKTVDLSSAQYLMPETAITKENFWLEDGAIVMAMTGATVGKYGLIVNIMDSVALLNQRVARFYPLLDMHWFLYFHLSYLVSQIISIAEGSAQANISSTNIEAVKAVIPQNCLAKSYNNSVCNYGKNYIHSTRKIQTLTSLRDTLLPKLISGELRVDDPERFLEEVL